MNREDTFDAIDKLANVAKQGASVFFVVSGFLEELNAALLPAKLKENEINHLRTKQLTLGLSFLEKKRLKELTGR